MIEERLSVLKEIFLDYEFWDAKDEFVTWCPHREGCNNSHHKKKLQINIQKNTFNCWVCDYSGFIYRLLRDHASSEQKNRYMKTVQDFALEQEAPDNSLEYPEFAVSLLDALRDPKAVRSLEWLRGETGASDEVLFQNKIGYCLDGEHRGRIVFPSFDFSGDLNFYQTRDVDREDRFKYINCKRKIRSVIFNEILIDWRKPLIIVESIKSQLRHSEISNIVPILGTSFNKKYSLFRKSILEDIPRVFIALDSEAIYKAYDIMEYYYSCGIDVRFVSLPEQADNLSTDSFLENLAIAKSFSKEDSLLLKLKRIKDNL